MRLFLFITSFTLFLFVSSAGTCIDDNGVCGIGCSMIEDSDCFGTCGNGKCESTESPCTCAIDCGVCEGSYGDAFEKRCAGDVCVAIAKFNLCGNGICEGTENVTCASDCAAVPLCGNGVCDEEETTCNCPRDCGTCRGDCPAGWERACAKNCVCVSKRFVCGNGVCESGENFATCKKDCLPRSVHIECSKPTGEYLCGDLMPIVCRVRADGATGTGFVVTVDGFFGSLQLFDDGVHGDGEEHDGVYGNTVLIPNNTREGVYTLTVSAQRLVAKGQGKKDVRLLSQVTILLSCTDVVIRGQHISCRADIYRREQKLDGLFSWAITAPGGELFTGQSNATFGLRTSYLEKAGLWKVETRFTDEFGNIGYTTAMVTVADRPSLSLQTTLLSPDIKQMFKKGERLKVLLNVTENNKPVEYVRGAIILPDGEKLTLMKIGDLYGTEIELKPQYPSKTNLTIYLERPYDGERLPAVRELTLPLTILSGAVTWDVQDSYLDRELFFRFTTSYAGQCAPLDTIELSLRCDNQKKEERVDVSEFLVRTGVCSYELRAPAPENVTACTIEVRGKDEGGNVLLAQYDVVRRQGLGDVYGLIGVVVLAVLIGGTFLAHLVSRYTLQKRLQLLETEKKRIEKMYYEEGTLRRDLFLAREAELSVAIKEIREKLGERRA